MYNGKNKAVTFSYDDGVTQDKRLIKLLNKYGLKATFNINSELLGHAGALIREDVTVAHVKPQPCEVKGIYNGHEVAVHTLTHPLLTAQTDDEVIRQVEEDRKNLEEYTGCDVVGMAYPCGGKNCDERVADIIRNNTKIKYSRTIISSYSFDLQDDLILFNPTIHHKDWDKLFEMGEEFIKLKTDEPKLFYIWGHSYEFDIDDTWDKFEEFCKLISNKDDIFYGTNREVFGF